MVKGRKLNLRAGPGNLQFGNIVVVFERFLTDVIDIQALGDRHFPAQSVVSIQRAAPDIKIGANRQFCRHGGSSRATV